MRAWVGGEIQMGDMTSRWGGNQNSVFNNVDTLLALSVSHGALDSSKTKMKLVKEEAQKKHSIFISI